MQSPKGKILSKYKNKGDKGENRNEILSATTAKESKYTEVRS